MSTGAGTGFRPGDHLRVNRGPYHHHGIYVGDGRVVQFGGRIGDKLHARIEEVSLDDFRHGGTAHVVEHGGHSWPGIYDLPPSDDPAIIVARARRLVRHHPKGAYNVFGRNCESIANWCVAGYGESHQWKRAQGINALIGAGLALWFSYRVRRGGVTRGEIQFALTLTAVRVVPLALYHWHNKRFYDDVRRMPPLGPDT